MLGMLGRLTSKLQEGDRHPRHGLQDRMSQTSLARLNIRADPLQWTAQMLQVDKHGKAALARPSRLTPGSAGDRHMSFQTLPPHGILPYHSETFPMPRMPNPQVADLLSSYCVEADLSVHASPAQDCLVHALHNQHGGPLPHDEAAPQLVKGT